MTQHTPRGYPYPELPEPAEVPADIQALAVAIDTDMTAQDTKNADQAYVDQALAGKADTGHTHQWMGVLLPANAGGGVGDGAMSPFLINVGTLAPGEEKQFPITFNPGMYFFPGVQHSSTYIHAVVQDLGNGTGYVKVRNSTTATTHTNVKVHVLFVNPPPA